MYKLVIKFNISLNVCTFNHEHDKYLQYLNCDFFWSPVIFSWITLKTTRWLRSQRSERSRDRLNSRYTGFWDAKGFLWQTDRHLECRVTFMTENNLILYFQNWNAFLRQCKDVCCKIKSKSCHFWCLLKYQDQGVRGLKDGIDINCIFR